MQMNMDEVQLQKGKATAARNGKGPRGDRQKLTRAMTVENNPLVEY